MPRWVPDNRDALWWLAEDLAAVFATAEQELTKVLTSELRDLLTDDPTALSSRATRLNKSQQAAKQLADYLAEYTHEQIPQILDTAAKHGADTALTEVAKAATLPPVALGGPIGTRAVTAIVGDLTNGLDVVTNRVLRWPDDVWRRTIGQTSTNVLLGLDTGRQAQARAWQKVLAEGVTFVDKADRRWNSATYVEMATRTATRRAWEAQHTQTMADHGINLVSITVGSRACEKCAAWDGKILRTDNGPTGWITVDRADGEGTIEVYVAGTLDQAKEHGWLHPNCRCRPVSYLPGISKLEGNTHFDPEGHANEQELRRLEREVRKAKMEEAAALTPEQKKDATAKIRAKQAQIRDHVNKTGVPRRREREQLNYGHKIQVDGPQTRPVDGLPSMGRPDPLATPPLPTVPDTPTFLADIPRLDTVGDFDARVTEAMLATNPHFRDGIEYQINCQRVVHAFEMRMRGYDVTALPNPDDNWGRFNTGYGKALEGLVARMDESQGLLLKSQWRRTSQFRGMTEQQKTEWYERTSQAYKTFTDPEKHVRSIVESWPVGARGIVRFSRTEGGGHVFNVVRTIDGIRFIDAQSGDSNSATFKRYWKEVSRGKPQQVGALNTVGVARVDDLIPTEEILKALQWNS